MLGLWYAGNKTYGDSTYSDITNLGFFFCFCDTYVEMLKKKPGTEVTTFVISNK